MQKRGLYSLLCAQSLCLEILSKKKAFKLLQSSRFLCVENTWKGIRLIKDSLLLIARRTAFKHNMPHIQDKYCL